MARRFNELSVREQEQFKADAISGKTAFWLSEAYDMSYETARRNREEIREAERLAVQGGTVNDDTSAA